MTSDEINALPERVRRYIDDLEARTDSAGVGHALSAAREEAARHAQEVARLRTGLSAIAKVWREQGQQIHGRGAQEGVGAALIACAEELEALLR